MWATEQADKLEKQLISAKHHNTSKTHILMSVDKGAIRQDRLIKCGQTCIHTQYKAIQ